MDEEQEPIMVEDKNANSSDDEIFGVNNDDIEPEEWIQSLEEMIAALHTTQTKKQIFSLYALYVYYRVWQQFMRALISLLCSSIFGINL